jgi:hypothetical protein
MSAAHFLRNADKFRRFCRNWIVSHSLIYIRSTCNSQPIACDRLERGAVVIRVEDIRSFTDFTRHASAHLKRLKQTGRPMVLTINGTAEVVVQAAAAYQRLLRVKEKGRKRSRRKTSLAGTTG